MKKSKGQTVDLLYKNEIKKKNQKKKNKRKSGQQKENKEVINLDNEIVIGLTPKKEENLKEKKSKKKTSKKKQKNSKKKQNIHKEKKDNIKSKKVKTNKKSTMKIIKWIFIILFFAATISIFLLSSVFNIKEIRVINNSKISTEEIIKLSNLSINTNMFKTTNKTIKESIKTNAYIENVNIKRNINGIVTLDITERKPTYMLKFANAYVYINNQGYMLEMSEEPLDLPTITGFETPSEEIKEGNRLVVEDLKKLEDVIKIMNSASDRTFSKMITNIDISDGTNYKLTIESENKVVYFGDTTNINIKLLRIEEVMEKEKGKEGEIYFQNSEKTVFREKV